MNLQVMEQGNLPDKEGQMYHVTEDDLYLIPTAEVPITNIYQRCNFRLERFTRKTCRLYSLLSKRSRFIW